MTSEERQSLTNDEVLVERVLAAAGERPALPETLRVRWEATLRGELAKAGADRRRRRTVRWMSLAAGLVAVAVLVAQFTLGPSGAEPVGSVIVSRGVSEIGRNPASTGLELADSDVVRTGPSGFLAIELSGIDLRVAPDSVVEIGTGNVRLKQGSVYVDTVSGVPDGHLDVLTEFGRVVHTGTQFLVEASVDQLMFAVREGAVELITEWSRFDYAASETAAPFVTVWRGGSMELREVARHGGVWSWTELAGPGLVLNGQSAHEALSWAARERGLHLSYATPEARQRAEASLRGPADHALEAEEVLRLVGRVTTLAVEFGDAGEISVSERNDDTD